MPVVQDFPPQYPSENLAAPETQPVRPLPRNRASIEMCRTIRESFLSGNWEAPSVYRHEQGLPDISSAERKLLAKAHSKPVRLRHHPETDEPSSYPF